MARRHSPAAILQSDVATHAATSAWMSQPDSSGEVCAITMLTDKHKSSVCRLQLRGSGRRTVIAKRCANDYGAADIERQMFRDILPSAGLPSLDILGHVIEPSSGSFWLFLEDLGDDDFSPSSVEDRQLFANWLATLHQFAPAGSTRGLPDRDAGEYLRRLRRAARSISENLEQAWITDDGRALLTRVLGLLDRLEQQWTRVEDVCARCPSTIVHGDLVAKNIRLRTGGGRREIVVLDWEMAGVGTPAIDLKLLGDDLAYYAATMRRVWPGLSDEVAKALAGVGRIFRSLLVLDWKACELPYDWCSADSFEPFAVRFEDALKTVESDLTFDGCQV